MSEARAKLVCVCVLREFIRNAENTLAMSKINVRYQQLRLIRLEISANGQNSWLLN